MKKYIDSNVFIYAVLYEDARALACRQILTHIVAGDFDAVTSVLTWDEFTYVLARNLGQATAALQGERFLRFPGLTFEPCTPAILAAAQEIYLSTSLRPRDAIHIATARHVSAHAVVSEDSDFDGHADLPRECPSEGADG